MTLIGQNEEQEHCTANALRVTAYARRFTRGHWSFLGLGSEKKWYGTHVNKPDGEWDRTAEGVMLDIFSKANILYFVSAALRKEEN